MHKTLLLPQPRTRGRFIFLSVLFQRLPPTPPSFYYPPFPPPRFRAFGRSQNERVQLCTDKSESERVGVGCRREKEGAGKGDPNLDDISALGRRGEGGEGQGRGNSFLRLPLPPAAHSLSPIFHPFPFSSSFRPRKISSLERRHFRRPAPPRPPP